MRKDKQMVDKRPVYINVFTFAFPITAIVSILHRISGVVVFLSIPLFLSMLQDGLYYPWTTSSIPKVLVWLVLTVFMYHLIAGIRHLCMDAGYAESKRAATISSYAVFIMTILFSILIGLRLC